MSLATILDGPKKSEFIELSTELAPNADGEVKHVIVDWEAPEDPSNPRNWARRTKLIHLVLVSAYTFST